MLNWIKELVEEARKKRWCTKVNCTTCGADYFRTAIVLKSRDAGKIDLRLEKINENNRRYYTGSDETPPSKPRLCDLPFKEDFRACVRTICRELSKLSKIDIVEMEDEMSEPPLRLIFCEIYNNDTKDLIRRMVPYDKPAGKYLSSIEEHSRQVIASQQKAFEESEAQFIAAKKRRKERAKKHLEREKLKKKKLKNL